MSLSSPAIVRRDSTVLHCRSVDEVLMEAQVSWLWENMSVVSMCVCVYMYVYAWLLKGDFRVCVCVCVCVHVCGREYAQLVRSHEHWATEWMSSFTCCNCRVCPFFPLRSHRCRPKKFSEFNIKMKLHNYLIEWLKAEEVGWQSYQADSLGKDFIVLLADALWYLDGRHDTVLMYCKV